MNTTELLRQTSLILLLGAPGAGKSWLTDRLIKHHRKFALLRSSDVLSACIKQGGALGTKIKRIIDAGGLVPDDIVIAQIFGTLEKLVAEGYTHIILDGFPRTCEQAAILEEHQPNLTIFHIDLDLEMCFKRITEAPREGRDDDKSPDVVRKRLRLYLQKTKPVLEFWMSRRSSAVCRIDGLLEVDGKVRAVEDRLGLSRDMAEAV